MAGKTQLEGMLEKSFQTHDQFIAAQIKYIKDSMELTDVSSGKRSAEAIHAFIKKEIQRL
ncbi:MAG: hypothetical protein H8E14_14265 [Candidatus Marinimicrobia bacterium]|nr:hypothetical protein [Candidatus Neomarinimicrobiota bacterium]